MSLAPESQARVPAVERRAAVVLAACLVGIVVCLILLGLLSDTVARHVLQAAPVVIAAGAMARRSAATTLFAVGVCSFWLVVLGLIWLFLAGLSGAAPGSYSPGEVFLTIGIAVFAVAGILRGARMGNRTSSVATAAMITAGFMIQAVFMAVSLRFLD